MALNIKYAACFWALYCWSQTVQCQYFENPSFEYTTGMGVTPDGWFACNTESTPDVQPTSLNMIQEVSLSASDGNTFLGMVIRGNEGINIPKNEAVQAKLQIPLEQNNCYLLSIDLASATYLYGNTDGNAIHYTATPQLRIYGGNYQCDTAELLAISDSIKNISWKTFEFFFIPQKASYTYLKFEVYLKERKAGYILLDNIRLRKGNTHNVIIRADTTVKPSDNTVLTARYSETYTWTPEHGLSCYDCRSPQVEIENSEVFVCLTADTLGCPVKEVFSLHVNVFIPNTITPNDDGINDNFRIDGLTANSTFTVFNRLGEVVFTSSNYDNSWKGKDKNGNMLASGTYWYVLKITDDTNIYKGFVYIKR